MSESVERTTDNCWYSSPAHKTRSCDWPIANGETPQLHTPVWVSTLSRHSDFVCGLPTANPTATLDLDVSPLSPADRLRLVHTYVTSTISDGGLGIAPGSADWDRVESIMMLHDYAFNDEWIRSWTRRELGFVTFDKIRYQVSDARISTLTSSQWHLAVRRGYCPLLRLPLVLHKVPHRHFTSRRLLLLLRRTIQRGLLVHLTAMVHRVRRIVADPSTHLVSALGNKGFVPRRKAAPTTCATSVVEERPSDGRQSTSAHAVRRCACGFANKHVRLRGVCN